MNNMAKTVFNNIFDWNQSSRHPESSKRLFMNGGIDLGQTWYEAETNCQPIKTPLVLVSDCLMCSNV